MVTRMQQWGNRRAIRIPRSFATEVGLAQDSEGERSLLDGTLVLAPVASQRTPRAVLLSQITDENLHTEIATGDAVGDERW